MIVPPGMGGIEETHRRIEFRADPRCKIWWECRAMQAYYRGVTYGRYLSNHWKAARLED